MDPYYDIGKQNFQSAKASCLIRLSVVRKLSFHENCDELWRDMEDTLYYITYQVSMKLKGWKGLHEERSNVNPPKYSCVPFKAFVCIFTVDKELVAISNFLTW